MSGNRSRPEFHVAAADIQHHDDGFATLPEAAFLANTLRLFEAEFESDGNPMWAWRALNEIDAYRSRGIDVDVPGWILGYVFGAARAVLSIDPAAVQKDKMPHAIASALGLTRRGGGPGYLATWHKKMDALIASLDEPVPMSDQQAEYLRAKLSEARAMPSDKQGVEAQIKQGVKARRSPTRKSRDAG